MKRSLKRFFKKGENYKGNDRRNKVKLEQLEPRILLSADIETQMAAGANDLTLRLQNMECVDYVQLVNNADQSVVQSRALNDTSGVVITGSDQNDQLTIDFNGFSDPLPITFKDNSQIDNDSLQIIGKAGTTWNINDANTGWGDSVLFSGIENLIGGDNNEDTFIFSEYGTLSGMIDGGTGGFDTLSIEGGSYNTVEFTPTGPDAGTVNLDGNLITYAGLEPIVVNSGTVTDIIFNLTTLDDQAVIENPGTGLQIRSANASFELTTFSLPSGSLTINGMGGNDTVTVSTALNMSTADLTINAETINVSSSASIIADAVTLSAVGSDSAQVTVSGDITATGAVDISAQAGKTVTLSDFSSGTYSGSSTATAEVAGSGTVVSGATVAITAHNTVMITASAMAGSADLAGFDIDQTNTTWAKVTGGASVTTIGAGATPSIAGSGGARILIEALDDSQISVTVSSTPALDTDYLEDMTLNYSLLYADVTLTRTTTAEVATGALNSAGLIKVKARNENGVSATADSGLVGVALTIATDNVTARVANAAVGSAFAQTGGLSGLNSSPQEPLSISVYQL